MKKLLFVLAVFIFTVKILESLHPFGNGDSLYYHLVFPLKLFEIGFTETHLKLCGALQTGLMEYLYVLPYLIFKNNVIRYQQLSQLMHFVLGVGLGAFITFYKLKNKNFYWATLGAISLLTISKSGDFFLLAKNDGIVPMLTLLASILIIERKQVNQNQKTDSIILISLIFMPLVKLNGIIPSVVLNLYFFIKNRKEIKTLAVFFILQAVSLSIVLIRNWYFMKSPFFPGMLNIFPGNASDEMIKTYNYFMSNPTSWQSVLENIKNFFTGKLIYLIAIPCFVINLLKKKNELNLYFIFSLAMLTVYLKINGGITTERLYFFCYFLTNFFIFKTFSEYQTNNLGYSFILILILIDSKLDKSFQRIKRTISLEMLSSSTYINEISSRNKLWDFIDKNRLQTNIITDQWNELLHAPAHTQIDCTECNLDGFKLKRCNSNDLAAIKNYNYAILAKNENNMCYGWIKSNNKKLTTVAEYELYQIK